MLRSVVLLALGCAALSASADVLHAGPGGFTTQHEVRIEAPRAKVWSAAVDRVGAWWHPDHTISGDATRLRIEARPLGCFCESLGAEDAGVVHLTATMVNPTVLLRLTGGLGPLGLMGVNGNMTWEFADTDDSATTVRFTYAVGGYREGGLESIAGPVDFVIGEALARLQAFVESGDPDSAKFE